MREESASARPSRWWSGARFGLGALVSMVTLCLAAKGTQWSEVVAVLSKADSRFVFLALVSFLVTNWAKAVRWQLLFYPSHSRLSTRKCVSVLYIGQLSNSLLPIRIGELVRAFLIGGKNGISKVFALATTVVEKALDSVMLLSLIALLSLSMPMPPWLRRSSLIVSGILALLLLTVIIITGQRKSIEQVLKVWIDRRPRLAFLRVLNRLAEASGQLHALRDIRVQMRLWTWSILIWTLATATNALTLEAVHIKVAPLASPLLLVALMTGAILPTSPAQLGVFHYLCILTLSIFGVERSVALGYAILLHFVVYVPIIVGGVLGLWVENYELGELHIVSRGRADE
ncbi:MAG: flippase-like domain-containing protein [Chloroflexi bacterium]|nr:flippase-like domain-containing protein [Chloroflexota bacterium]